MFKVYWNGSPATLDTRFELTPGSRFRFSNCIFRYLTDANAYVKSWLGYMAPERNLNVNERYYTTSLLGNQNVIEIREVQNVITYGYYSHHTSVIKHTAPSREVKVTYTRTDFVTSEHLYKQNIYAWPDIICVGEIIDEVVTSFPATVWPYGWPAYKKYMGPINDFVYYNKNNFYSK